MKISMFTGSRLEGRQHPLPETENTFPASQVSPKSQGRRLPYASALAYHSHWKVSQGGGGTLMVCPPYLGQLFYPQVLGTGRYYTKVKWKPPYI